MVKAQEWLDKRYPQEGGCLRENESWFNNFGKKRSEIEKLNISYQNLEGSADLSDFSSLKKLYCYNNQLTSLNLSNCSQLEVIRCDSNNLSSDLTFLTPLVNLKELELENNNFHGSLAPLQNLTKLWYLNIGNTNLNKGVEYLPESLKLIYYSTKRLDCEVLEYKISQIKERLDSEYWKDIHGDFQPRDKKAWIEQGLIKQQTKQLRPFTTKR